MGLKDISLIILVAAALPLASCGDDDSEEQPATETPLSSPTPTPSPGPSPTPQAVWNHVDQRVFTDMIDPNTCDMPFTIKIDADGDYRAGPCTEGGDDFTTGRISNEERMELDNRARAVAVQDLSEENCQAGAAIAGSETDLSSRGRHATVFKDNPDKYCYRGTEASSKDLHYYLRSLTDKYYPSRDDF